MPGITAAGDEPLHCAICLKTQQEIHADPDRSGESIGYWSKSGYFVENTIQDKFGIQRDLEGHMVRPLCDTCSREYFESYAEISAGISTELFLPHYKDSLKELILEYCSQQNLDEVTALTERIAYERITMLAVYDNRVVGFMSVKPVKPNLLDSKYIFVIDGIYVSSMYRMTGIGYKLLESMYHHLSNMDHYCFKIDETLSGMLDVKAWLLDQYMDTVVEGQYQFRKEGSLWVLSTASRVNKI